MFLYRYYVGRREVSGGSSIDVFIDDGLGTNFSGANRAWYDGVGYASVTDLTFDVADFDHDGDVDSDDLARWSADHGVSFSSDANGDGQTDGADLLLWQAHLSQPAPESVARNSAVPEPTAALLAGIAILALVRGRQA